MKPRSLLALLLFTAMPSFAGVEIGNAEYLPFRSVLGRFETVYPSAWEALFLGSSVSFTSSESAINIESQTREDIRTTADLANDLRTRQPELEWTPITLAGKPGFARLSKDNGTIHLLRDERELLVIRFRLSKDDLAARMDIQLILDSLRMTDPDTETAP